MDKYLVVELQATDSDGVIDRNERFMVLDIEAAQVASVHLYTEEEAVDIRREYEEAALIHANWPPFEDPEVQELVNDEEFEPIDPGNVDVLGHPMYRLHQAAEIVARERAGIGAQT